VIDLNIKKFEYGSYDEYLSKQKERSLIKWESGQGHEVWHREITLIIKLLPLDINKEQFFIVCMGVRQGKEIDVWKQFGFNKIIGIELAKSTRQDVIEADFANLKNVIDDSSVDLIYSCHSFEHSFSVNNTITEWRRILKNNSFIWITIPHYHTPDASDPILIKEIATLLDIFQPCKILFKESSNKEHRIFLQIKK
jgi:hypothetical protein